MTTRNLEDAANVGYLPHEGETFMNERQQTFFRQKLNLWREQLLNEGRATLSLMQTGIASADEMDVACQEMGYALELRTRDRERKLIARIEAALHRLDIGEYGYCEETGDQITLKRLIARPIATLSIEAQERHERLERSYRMAS